MSNAECRKHIEILSRVYWRRISSVLFVLYVTRRDRNALCGRCNERMYAIFTGCQSTEHSSTAYQYKSTTETANIPQWNGKNGKIPIVVECIHNRQKTTNLQTDGQATQRSHDETYKWKMMIIMMLLQK